MIVPLALAILLQIRPCSPQSAGNPTLYRPESGVMHCLDWDQATCSYVERPCRGGELSILCRAIPVTCQYIAPRLSRAPRPDRQPVTR
jgi:hypothetical protein